MAHRDLAALNAALPCIWLFGEALARLNALPDSGGDGNATRMIASRLVVRWAWFAFHLGRHEAVRTQLEQGRATLLVLVAGHPVANRKICQSTTALLLELDVSWLEPAEYLGKADPNRQVA